MGRKRTVTNEQVGHALRRRHGIVSAAARDLGVNRLTVYSRINESDELQRLVRKQRTLLRQYMGYE